jgi:hypothetical protein
LRGKRAYFSFQDNRYIRGFSFWCAIAGLFILFFLNPHLTLAQEEPEYDEVSVLMYIPQIGVVEGPAYVKGESLYLSVSDLFTFLKIQNSLSPTYDSVTGYFINPESVFLISRTLNRIEYQNKTFQLKPGDLIRSENNLFLRSNYFGEVFGLECTFDFRSLSVTLKTKLELPIIREMKQELMRKNLRRLKGEMKADTTINRTYPLFHMGMADWSILSTQQLPGKTNLYMTLTLGSVIAGGEANITLNYNNNVPFNEDRQSYYWRFVNNDWKLVRQVTVGKISPQPISTLNGSLLGLQVTNTPTIYRRSFSNYRLSDYTEPGWIVELYVNNVLVDYVKADASGFFVFDVPLVYGNSTVKLRFYGPWGEERVREETFDIPFTFVPPKQLEYTLSSGIVEDRTSSRFSRANLNYGVGQRLTVGGGFEYLTSVSSGNLMPFLDFSVRMASNLILSGEYTYGVRGRAILNYRLPWGLSLEVNYVNYHPDQTAVFNPFLEDRRIALSMPVRSRKFNAFVRATVDQIILPRASYISSEFLISGSVLGVSTNLTTYGMFSNPGRPSITSTLSLGFRFRRGLVFTPQVQYDFSYNQLMSLKFGLEKNVFIHGVVNLSYEYNFWGSINNLQLGMRYDFPFAQASITSNYSNNVSSFAEAARGSIMLDRKTNYIGTSNRSNVGKGGIVVMPFLDLNGNGHRDADEPKIPGLNLHLTGGIIEQNTHDSTVRVYNLEPYTNYFIEIDYSSFVNVAWQIKNPMISVAIDPNQFKLIEVPVSVSGEVSGMVYLNDDGNLTGQNRIIVSFYNSDSIRIAKTLSESDGFFTYFGFLPGNYTARIDAKQLQNLDMAASPGSIPFTVKRTIDGDQVDGLEFVLHLLHPDTSELLAKGDANAIPPIQEQQTMPGLKGIKDSVIQNKPEIVHETKKPDGTVPPMQSQLKPIQKDSSLAIAKVPETQAPPVQMPASLVVTRKQSDTTISSIIKKRSDTLQTSLPPLMVKPVSPDTSNKLLTKKAKQPAIPAAAVSQGYATQNLIINDSCDFAVQSSVSYTLMSALTAQAMLADTFGRPVIIISEGGVCKLRITGFCGRKDAELCQVKLAGIGFDNTYILRMRGYSIQVGAFHVKAYALEARGRLVDAFSRPILIVYEDGYYKVRITGFDRFSDAKKFLPVLNNNGFHETYLLKSH